MTYLCIKQVVMKFENNNVLITGGASGIGKIMGRMALEKGADILIICKLVFVSLDQFFLPKLRILVFFL